MEVVVHSEKDTHFVRDDAPLFCCHCERMRGIILRGTIQQSLSCTTARMALGIRFAPGSDS